MGQNHLIRADLCPNYLQYLTQDKSLKLACAPIHQSHSTHGRDIKFKHWNDLYKRNAKLVCWYSKIPKKKFQKNSKKTVHEIRNKWTASQALESASIPQSFCSSQNDSKGISQASSIPSEKTIPTLRGWRSATWTLSRYRSMLGPLFCHIF
jgi:GTP-binding protein EngB required for normal cell division